MRVVVVMSSMCGMGILRLSDVFLATIAGLTSSCLGQCPAGNESVLSRPVVIGASISAGFSSGMDLSQVLDVMIEREHQDIDSSFSMLFWENPVETVESQSQFALEANPTLLVAIDFLFWLVYSSRNIAGAPIATEGERLDLLEYGLRQLERFACPIIVADFPLYTATSGRMPGPVELPSTRTLRVLNQRLRDWASQRGNVIILPLAKYLESIQENEEFRIGGYVCPAGMSEALIRVDRVHLSLEGLVWLTYLITTEMLRKGWVEESEINNDLLRILRELHDEVLSSPGYKPSCEAVPFENP